eukprot:TRINITY_DN17503_c0_g1_i1.p1 TRINITY_DN17503_c0_g1~~TRINITY_DN17503_c0_g1_i1.p1  ORF type:complete len:555 (+),score=136.10 TRINITY_DN17503_c0_g1_i1:52-1716(+)
MLRLGAIMACAAGMVCGGDPALSPFLQCNLTTIEANQVPLSALAEYVDRHCVWRAYLEDNLLGAFVVCAVAIVAVSLAAPIFYVSREWFKCCGGLRPAPDAFCWVKEYAINPRTAYSEAHISRSKHFALYVLVAALCAAAVAWYGVIKVHGHADSARDAFFDTPSGVAHSAERYGECLDAVRGASSEAAVVDAAKAVLDDVHKAQLDRYDRVVDAAKPMTDGYLATFWFVVGGLCFAALVTLLAGVALAYRNIDRAGPLVVCAVLFILLAMAILYVLIDIAVAFAASEFCDVMEAAAAAPDTANNVLTAVMKQECDGDSHPHRMTLLDDGNATSATLATFVSASQSIATAVIPAAVRACRSFYDAAGSNPGYVHYSQECGADGACTTDAVVRAFTDVACVRVDPDGDLGDAAEVSAADCAASPSCAVGADGLRTAVLLWGNEVDVLKCNDADGAGGSCMEFTAEKYLSPEQVEHCRGMVVGGHALLAAFVLLGVVFFAGIFVYARGSKSFIAATGGGGAYAGLVEEDHGWRQPLNEDARAQGRGGDEMDVMYAE